MYKPVLDVMLVGVGGKYCNVTDLAVPATPHALCPLTLILPPINPVLYLILMLALSAVAEIMVVKFGLVHLYTEIADCTEVGTVADAVYVTVSPIHGVKLLPVPVNEVIVGGANVALSAVVFGVLIEHGVTAATDNVSFVNPERNATTTAVSSAPNGLTWVIVAFVPTFKIQLYEVA